MTAGLHADLFGFPLLTYERCQESIGSARRTAVPRPFFSGLEFWDYYNRDPSIKALKRRGFINHGSTLLSTRP